MTIELTRRSSGGSSNFPYFECTTAQWETYTNGMSEKGKKSLASMLAHHCLLVRRFEEGWLLTRADMISSFMNGKRETPWAFCHNDGSHSYSFTGKVAL